jgi:ribosomal protein L14
MIRKCKFTNSYKNSLGDIVKCVRVLNQGRFKLDDGEVVVFNENGATLVLKKSDLNLRDNG